MALGALVNARRRGADDPDVPRGRVAASTTAPHCFLIGTVGLLSLLLRPVMTRTKRYSKALSAMLVDYGREVTEATRMARDVRVFHADEAGRWPADATSRPGSRVRQRAAFASAVTSPVYQYTGMLLVIARAGAAQGLGSTTLRKIGTIALLLLRSMTFGQQIQNSYQSHARLHAVRREARGDAAGVRRPRDQGRNHFARGGPRAGARRAPLQLRR